MPPKRDKSPERHAPKYPPSIWTRLHGQKAVAPGGDDYLRERVKFLSQFSGGGRKGDLVVEPLDHFAAELDAIHRRLEVLGAFGLSLGASGRSMQMDESYVSQAPDGTAVVRIPESAGANTTFAFGLEGMLSEAAATARRSRKDSEEVSGSRILRLTARRRASRPSLAQSSPGSALVPRGALELDGRKVSLDGLAREASQLTRRLAELSRWEEAQCCARGLLMVVTPELAQMMGPYLGMPGTYEPRDQYIVAGRLVEFLERNGLNEPRDIASKPDLLGSPEYAKLREQLEAHHPGTALPKEFIAGEAVARNEGARNPTAKRLTGGQGL